MLTKSHAMLRNISQAPALLTSMHMAVREQEAQAAVTLNDSMNRSELFRAHCLAVSCFDMGPNASLALGQRVWVQSPVHEEENCSQPAETWVVLFLAGWEGTTVTCGSHRAGWMSVTAAHLPSPPLTIRLSVCHSVCLLPWQTAEKKVWKWMSLYLSGVSLT